MSRNYRADGFPAGAYSGCTEGWVAVSPDYVAGPAHGTPTAVSATFHLSTNDAIKLMAELPLAALASSPTDQTRALLRSTVASMLEALDGLTSDPKAGGHA